MATASMYGLLLKSLFRGEVDFEGGTVKVLLTTSAYIPDQDSHQYLADLSDEVNGTGYTAGGATLANKTATYIAASNTLALDADNVSWPNSTITARYAVVYVDTGNPSTSPLICWVDFESDQSSVDGEFTINWNASGIATMTAI